MAPTERKESFLGSDALFIVGGAIIILASVVDLTSLLTWQGWSKLFSALDPRQWRVATLLAVASTVALLCSFARAFFQWRSGSLEDEDDALCARRLLALLAAATLQLWLYRWASTTEFPRYAWFQARELFARGQATRASILIAVVGAVVFAMNFTLVARFASAWLNRFERRR